MRLFVRYAVNICAVVGGLSLILLMAHICIDIFLRTFFDIVLLGTIESVSYFYMVGATVAAFVIVESNREHVFVEVFMQKASERSLHVADVFSGVLKLLYISALAIGAYYGAQRATGHGEIIFVGNYDLIVWPARWILAVGLAVMAVVSLVNLWQLVRGELQKPAE